jgi:putative redox protein
MVSQASDSNCPDTSDWAKLSSVWKGEGTFEHHSASGQVFHTDAALPDQPPRDLNGPTPVEMVIGALAGCAGIDLALFLPKLRLEPTSIKVDVAYERAEKHPRVYTRIHLNFYIETDPVDLKKVQRAVAMSMDTYCTVSAALAPGAQITYTIHYDGETVHGSHA